MNKEAIEDLKAHFVLFVCEGTAEEVVIKRLVESDSLVVPEDRVVKDRMTFERYTRRKPAAKIAEQYLNERYPTETDDRLLIARIADSSTPVFELPKAYRERALDYPFVTSPEIEMLPIFKEGAFRDWQKASRKDRQLKPSEFCVRDLKLSRIKEREFLLGYWDDVDVLKSCIRQYAEKCPNKKKSGYQLLDLLK